MMAVAERTEWMYKGKDSERMDCRARDRKIAALNSSVRSHAYDIACLVHDQLKDREFMAQFGNNRDLAEKHLDSLTKDCLIKAVNLVEVLREFPNREDWNRRHLQDLHAETLRRKQRVRRESLASERATRHGALRAELEALDSAPEPPAVQPAKPRSDVSVSKPQAAPLAAPQARTAALNKQTRRVLSVLVDLNQVLVLQNAHYGHPDVQAALISIRKKIDKLIVK